MDIVKATVNWFMEFIGCVFAGEVEKCAVQCDGFADDAFFLQGMKERRERALDHCIRHCKRLNKLCEEYRQEPFYDFDTDDRSKVAEFVGSLAMELYSQGIGRRE